VAQIPAEMGTARRWRFWSKYHKKSGTGGNSACAAVIFTQIIHISERCFHMFEHILSHQNPQCKGQTYEKKMMCLVFSVQLAELAVSK
jgi:hypothetical protein